MLLSRACAGTRSKRWSYSAETRAPNPRSGVSPTIMGHQTGGQASLEVCVWGEEEYIGAHILNISSLSVCLLGPARYIPNK